MKKYHFKLYFMEAVGLGVFMLFACFFSVILESDQSPINYFLRDYPYLRLLIMGIFLWLTALFILSSKYTAPSGSYINPALTLVELRLKHLSIPNAIFYILFQFLGGIIAVFSSYIILGDYLTILPMNYALKIPDFDIPSYKAFIYESALAFIMVILMLYITYHKRYRNYSKYLSAILITSFVIFSGPVSRFGMDPNKTYASDLPFNIWYYLWIFSLSPIAGVLLGTEVFLFLIRCKKTSYPMNRISTLFRIFIQK